MPRPELALEKIQDMRGDLFAMGILARSDRKTPEERFKTASS